MAASGCFAFRQLKVIFAHASQLYSFDHPFQPFFSNPLFLDDLERLFSLRLSNTWRTCVHVPHPPDSGLLLLRYMSYGRRTDGFVVFVY